MACDEMWPTQLLSQAFSLKGQIHMHMHMCARPHTLTHTHMHFIAKCYCAQKMHISSRERNRTKKPGTRAESWQPRQRTVSLHLFHELEG